MSTQQRHQRSFRLSVCSVVLLALAAFSAGPTLAAPGTVALEPAVASQAGVGNFLGLAPGAAIATLQDRAKFVDQNFNPIEASAAQGVIVWQSPLPGQPATPTGDVRLLATNDVPMPALEGMRVSDAKALMLYRGLALDVVSLCGANGRAANEDEMDWKVTHQCVAPNDVLTAGSHVGVVIQPWPEDGLSPAAAFALGALVGLAAGTALIFFMRRSR